MLSAQEIDTIFRRFQDANPSPVTELKYNNPYTLLVAVVLSAQATDKGVNKATEVLFAVADTAEQIIDMGEEKLAFYIKSIGLYKTKARNIILLSKKIIKDFKGCIPDNLQDLLSLPGVGQKTANVILNEYFKQPTIAVDTHVFRVCNRTGIATGAKPKDIEVLLQKRIDDQWKLHAHHWLILHGRYTCAARSPNCKSCSINDICKFYTNTYQ